MSRLGAIASCSKASLKHLTSKANWSSGQDDALSRRKPGFDSRIGHGRQNNSLFCFCNNARCFRGAAGSAPHS